MSHDTTKALSRAAAHLAHETREGCEFENDSTRDESLKAHQSSSSSKKVCSGHPTTPFHSTRRKNAIGRKDGRSDFLLLQGRERRGIQ